jgi:tRNA A37 N6-isopentenylltransferase MiaA
MADLLTRADSNGGLKIVLQRGKVPIVVGGTGFYLRWYVHGRPQTPASTQVSVARVQRLLKEARHIPVSMPCGDLSS